MGEIMRWKNQGKEMNLFSQSWLDCSQVMIFGLGNNAKNCIGELSKDIEIVAIIDNDCDKHGFYKGINVISLERALKENEHVKIIISTHYEEISHQLKEQGLIEDEDFCEINKFIGTWYWYNKHQLHIPEMHMALTTKCTLNCQHCNMYIPHYKVNGRHQEISEVLDTIKLYFEATDKTYIFALLGGEPFLYPYLEEVIKYIHLHFKEKIGDLVIVTNGTIFPQESVLNLLKECNVKVYISDYSKYVSYNDKLLSLKKRFGEYKIEYKIFSALEWLDFGFPHQPLNLSDEAAEYHMKRCSPNFKGINEKRLYYCHIVWSAVKSGLLPEVEDDYFELKELAEITDFYKISILEYYLGYMPNAYVSLCKKCNGCDSSNKNVVMPAIQA